MPQTLLLYLEALPYTEAINDNASNLLFLINFKWDTKGILQEAEASVTIGTYM